MLGHFREAVSLPQPFKHTLSSDRDIFSTKVGKGVGSL